MGGPGTRLLVCVVATTLATSVLVAHAQAPVVRRAAVLRVPQLVPGGDAAIAPGDEPSALAWDERGQRMWVFDARQQRLCRLGGAPGCFEIRGLNVPSRAVFAGSSSLWVLDEPGPQAAGPGESGRRPRLFQFRIPTDGTVKTLTPVHSFPIRRLPGNGAVTGLAWDGQALWLSAGQGLCSCVYRLDPRDGRVLLKFFPRCEPLGIAIDPKGKTLWIAAENGPERGAVLLLRSLEEKNTLGRPVSVQRTRRVVALPPAVRPMAIAVTSSELWVLDPKKTVRHFNLPQRQAGR